LLDPFRLRGFDEKLALSGRTLADLYPLLGLAAPDSPPLLRFDGRFPRESTPTSRTGSATPATCALRRLHGLWATAISAARPASRPGASVQPQATLYSWRLASTTSRLRRRNAVHRRGRNASAEQQAAAAHEHARTRVLPDHPYELDKLRSMDADVRWKAQRINAPKLPLDDMDAHLFIDAGCCAWTAELRRRRRRHPFDHPHGCARIADPHAADLRVATWNCRS
jgi:uncharacterized protein involved in outer membrane biogenesis